MKCIHDNSNRALIDTAIAALCSDSSYRVEVLFKSTDREYYIGKTRLHAPSKGAEVIKDGCISEDEIII